MLGQNHPVLVFGAQSIMKLAQLDIVLPVREIFYTSLVFSALLTLVAIVFARGIIQSYGRDGLLLSWVIVLLFSAPMAIFVAQNGPDFSSAVLFSSILIFGAVPFLAGTGIALLLPPWRTDRDR